MKKLLRYGMTTELWLWISFAVALILCPCGLLSIMSKLPATIDKGLGILCLFLCFLMVIRYELFKKYMFWIYFGIFGWMIAQGIHERVSLMRILGDSTQRTWYMCTLALLVFYVMPKEKLNRTLSVFLSTEIFFLSTYFILAIINASLSLVREDYVAYKFMGKFVGGRLSCFGNPNSAGIVAATLIMISIWSLVNSIRLEKLKVLARCIASVGLVVGTIALSLSRSRGSMVAVSAGVGVAVFILLYKGEHSKKKLAVSMLFAISVMFLSGGSLLLSKEIYNKIITEKVRVNSGIEASEEINGELNSYELTYAVNTITDRTLIWPTTLKMLDEKPEKWIWGYASHDPENKLFIYDVYEGRPEIMTVNSHSGYLQQLYMYGIPGAALTLMLLVAWGIQAAILAFSGAVPTEDRIPVAIVVTALVNATVEIFLFPSAQIYPITLFFFTAAGVISRQMKDSSTTKNIIKYLHIVMFTIIGIAIISFLSVLIYKKAAKKNESEFVLPPQIQQNENDYLRLNNYVSKDMMFPEYWTVNSNSKVELESFEEIARINYENRRMISTSESTFSQKEVGEAFYAKIAKQLVDGIKISDINPEQYLLYGEDTTGKFWEEIDKNADSESITSRIRTEFGFSVSRTVLKRYPTDEKICKKDSNLYYDELAQSDLQPFMPVVILHKSLDGEWVYVLTYGYGGWTRKENVALCRSREEWLERQEPESFIVVTGRELRLPTDPYHEKLSDLSLPMGTKLPIVKFSDAPESIHDRISYGNYISVLPTRGEDGYIKDEYVLIPSVADVNLGYLPYTEENIAGLAFRHLGAGYGWAGDNLAQDCSGYVREVFACFGFELPRSAKAQSQLEYVKNTDVSKKSDKEKIDILRDLPLGTLIYFPGHIMIYLGMEDDMPYCISSVGDYSTRELGAGNVVEVNTVIVTNMLDTTRGSGKSWLSAAERFVTP